MKATLFTALIGTILMLSAHSITIKNKAYMNKYLLHGKLTAKEGSAEKLASILTTAAQNVSVLKGCSLYAVSKDKDDPNSIWVTEIWDSKEDHDNSLKLDAVRQLIAQAIPILDGQPKRGQELEVLFVGGR